MIAVDTSALMALLLNENAALACVEVLQSDRRLLISAATVAETLIVANRRGMGAEMARLIDGLGFEIINVTASAALRVAAAYEHWGKRLHPAGLNFGDCFAYDVAKEHGCALLFTGDDFARTDIMAAI